MVPLLVIWTALAMRPVTLPVQPNLVPYVGSVHPLTYLVPALLRVPYIFRVAFAVW